MSYYLNQPRFPSGELLISASVLYRVFEFRPLLTRHIPGDWGEICKYYRADNDRVLTEDDEILSQYTDPDSQSVAALLTIVTATDLSYGVIFLLDDPTN